MMKSKQKIVAALAALMLLGPADGAEAPQPQSAGPRAVQAETEDLSAAVTLDGQSLFRVQGFSAYPAERRAKAIGERIAALAADRSVAPESIAVIEEATETRIVAGDRPIMSVFESEAAREGVSRQVMAKLIQARIAEAMRVYRQDRNPRVLLTGAAYALAVTLTGALLLLGLHRARGWLASLLERRVKPRIEGLEAQVHQLVQARHVWMALQGLMTTVYVGSALVLAYLWLELVLGFFPWTRWLGQSLAALFLDPFRAMALGLLETIPDLIFLAILFLVARYVIKLVELFFEGVERGAITLPDFEREWALPTYRIVRLLIVMLALVVAYPYVPGSGSDAFKGLSIFFGLILSLGSSSIIANTIAGYSLIYRRAFRVGDRIEVGGIRGDVMQARPLVTHLRTIRNEEIVVPNSMILNSQVVNFSTLAKNQGLILHTTVGIGYETPWRQVEQMLKLAAERTPGLLPQPPAFVHVRSLGDFAVTYEINAFTDNPQAIDQLYTKLHRNILDVFNEYNVQIMTPAYVKDPKEPKLVPKDQWYTAPALQRGDTPGDQP